MAPAQPDASPTGASPFAVKLLEMHVVHSCNLSCESCSHYSNHRHKGSVSLEEAERWIEAWKVRLSPQKFTLLGGEPTLHKDLTGFLRLGRRAWPSTHLRIITNGWYLDRHPDLPEAMSADPDCSLVISVHHGSEDYRQKLDPVFDLVEDWKSEYGIRVKVEPSFERWTRRYKGSGPAMEPFDDRDPRMSWTNCVARTSRQLHEGKLWKCAPLAYLGLQDRTVGLSGKWASYLAYEPLSPDCTDQELGEFLGREEESFCGMCPANPEHFTLPVPFSTSGPVHFQPPDRARVPAVVEARPKLSSRIHPLSHPLKVPAARTFGYFPIMRGPTAVVDDFESHASVLAPMRSPHRPHEHAEEEILIVLDGKAELVMGAGQNQDQYGLLTVEPGGFVYYPAFSAHTIRNSGTWPLSYLMFRWSSTKRRDGEKMGRVYADFRARPGGLPGTKGREFATRRILEGPTQYLGKLHCHMTELQPGGGYEPHTDPYDVAIVVLHGVVETMGRRVEPTGLIYYAAGEEHGMRNPQEQVARYLVFEFHGLGSATR